ncbi:DUF7827 domain-containing protein [Candidatus Halobonum tyrrellensis]|uniref:DUF7827 domain-containing protein n=1 Tax=Candidatus Halobonum tyrrellensis TaxID=1431545 RepID=UPI0009B5B6AA|nr:BGTF surface domain-containing protein [Candidatus Halobonum tyrrellensis]
MTENSDKLRAVVLAALMVFSVFAGTVALSGSAAAISGNNLTVGNNEAGEESYYQYNGTLADSVGTDTAVEEITLELPETTMTGAAVQDLSIAGSTVPEGNYSTSLTNSDSTLVITFTETQNVTNGNDIGLNVSNVDNAGSADTYTAELTLLDSSDTEIDSGTSDYTIVAPSTEDGALLFAGQEVNYNTNGDGYSNYILRSGDPDDDDSDQALRTLNAGEDGLISIDTESLDTGSYYITGDGNDVLEFEVIVQDFSAEFDDDSVGNTGDVANTTLEFSSDNRASQFDVNITEEDTALDDDELMDIFGSDGANGSGYTAVDADLDDDEDEDGIRLLNVGDGEEIETTFDDVDAGEYNFTFQVNDTEVSDSDSIEVTETDDGELSFNDSTITEEQGDIAAINVTFNEATDEGHLIIGDFADSGYQANISVVDDNDDGVVQVMFNTYTAGTADGAPIVWADGDDDEATLENRDADSQTIGDLLDTTNDGYQLATSTNTGTSSDAFTETLENPDELGTLFLEERSTDNITTWVAPDEVFDEYDDLDSASDVTEAIEGGYVTESNSLAEGDVAVFQVQASGLAGIIEDNTSDLLTFFQNEDSVPFNLEGPDRANQEQRTVDLSSTSSVDVITTNDNNVFIVMDTTDGGLEWQGDAGDVDDDTSLTANLTVTDNRLLDSDDADDDQTVETDFTSVEPDAEFDGDEPIEVPANEDATISGTTNVAPGTEVTVRVQSDEAEARFIKTNESVMVQPDGTFSAMFDFTDDATVDDTFEATIRDYGGDQVSIDGVVVEATNTSTSADTTTEGDTTTSEGTTTEGDTTTSEGTTTMGDETTSEEPATEGGETTTTTPGFTGVLALVALIGAALVALRRDN